GCAVACSLLSASPRPPGPLLFPYTTLFRSPAAAVDVDRWTCEHAMIRRCRNRPADKAATGAKALDGAIEPEVAGAGKAAIKIARSEEHTSELQSRSELVCRLLLEKKKPPTA